MNDFESNFVELLKSNEIQKGETSPIERQLSLAESFVEGKQKKCAKYALLIVYELLREYKNEDVKKRYNRAVKSFNLL